MSRRHCVVLIGYPSSQTSPPSHQKLCLFRRKTLWRCQRPRLAPPLRLGKRSASLTPRETQRRTSPSSTKPAWKGSWLLGAALRTTTAAKVMRVTISVRTRRPRTMLQKLERWWRYPWPRKGLAASAAYNDWKEEADAPWSGSWNPQGRLPTSPLLSCALEAR